MEPGCILPFRNNPLTQLLISTTVFRLQRALSIFSSVSHSRREYSSFSAAFCRHSDMYQLSLPCSFKLWLTAALEAQVSLATYGRSGGSSTFVIKWNTATVLHERKLAVQSIHQSNTDYASFAEAADTGQKGLSSKFRIEATLPCRTSGRRRARCTWRSSRREQAAVHGLLWSDPHAGEHVLRGGGEPGRNLPREVCRGAYKDLRENSDRLAHQSRCREESSCFNYLGLLEKRLFRP
jgi:hypothetical protein